MRMLLRGYELLPECHVKRQIATGKEWCIYQTSMKTYALVASSSAVSAWQQEGCGDIFKALSEQDTYAFVSSSPDYLIASLNDGPFPENSAQIEAFSTTFGAFRKKNPTARLANAVYVEEYSLLLPDHSHAEEQSDALLFGRWLTGGVSIAGTDVERMSSFMTWMPRDALIRCVDAAGLQAETMPLTRMAQKENLCGRIDGIPDDSFHLEGRPELEQFINDNIVDILRHESEYARMGIQFPGATLLYGPPGCGKTYAVDRLAEYLGWPRYDIEAGTIASPYIHDTSKKIAEVFTLAISNAPAILVIDEMEAFLASRATAATTGTHRVEEVAEFLRRIPEAIEHRVLIFGMTNMIESIDPAILRRGRFDHMIEVKMASAQEIESLLLARLKTLPVANDVQVPDIAKHLEGRPLSDVAYVLKEAGRFAVKAGKETIDRVCMESALNTLPKATKATGRKIGF